MPLTLLWTSTVIINFPELFSTSWSPGGLLQCSIVYGGDGALQEPKYELIFQSDPHGRDRVSRGNAKVHGVGVPYIQHQQTRQY
jgi:hypothetical protein